MYTYKDQIVLITGGSGDIGKALCYAFAAKGAKVFALDIKEYCFENPAIRFCHVNVQDPKSVTAFFRDTLSENGKPHILINNAAVAKFNKPIFEITDQEFTNIVEVNLCGAFYCSRAFIHANRGESYGRIINIASTRWAQNESGWDAYGASKGGLVSLTASMAISLSDTPITVNAVSPGWIETTYYEQLHEIDHAQHPSGRVGVAEDVVRAALFLSDPANNFINGENLVVDGGMSKRMFYHE